MFQDVPSRLKTTPKWPSHDPNHMCFFRFQLEHLIHLHLIISHPFSFPSLINSQSFHHHSRFFRAPPPLENLQKPTARATHVGCRASEKSKGSPYVISAVSVFPRNWKAMKYIDEHISYIPNLIQCVTVWKKMKKVLPNTPQAFTRSKLLHRSFYTQKACTHRKRLHTAFFYTRKLFLTASFCTQ